MSEQIKSNAHILVDQQAFLDAYDRAREVFGKIEGVEGVGFGQKHTSGEFKSDVAIIVFVSEKKSENELPPDQRIPSTFEGYRTDVRLVLEAVPGAGVCENINSYDTILGGIQIESLRDENNHAEFGTLGCIVKRRGDSGRENVYLLSNKHVMYATGAGEGDYIHHPFAPPPPDRPGIHFEQPPGPKKALGPIQAPAFYHNVTATVPDATPGTTATDTFFIDCAFARLDIDSKCGDSICTKDTTHYLESITDLQLHGVNTLSDVRSIARDVSIVTIDGDNEAGRPRVFKVGRTTGRTTGIVRSVNATLHTVGDPTVPGSPPMVGQNVIEISFDRASEASHVNCKGHAWFAEHGDSGSILVDEDNRVIGIIQGVPDPSNPATTPTASSVACHILPVLDKLGICIPVTTGTSHGSSRATDGSGIALAQPTASADLVDGQIVFASQSAATRPVRSPGFPDPIPILEPELNHMHDLLASFRQTEKGRELHDAFGYVRREIGYLIRNCRPVKVAWHRNQGPAYFAHLLNHLKGHSDAMPREVKGISRQTLLTRIAEVLAVHGSNPLRRAIEQHGKEFIDVVGNFDTARECIAYLREKENS
jgi:hypothetical protein